MSIDSGAADGTGWRRWLLATRSGRWLTVAVAAAAAEQRFAAGILRD